MPNSRFHYVTYIRTTPEKLWAALTEPEFTRQYWFETHQECDWKPGSTWKLVFADGDLADAGEVIESDPPHKLVLAWRNNFMPDLRAEGESRLTYEIQSCGDQVRLTVVHEIGVEGSKLIEAVSGGWPQILASLKTLLETGSALEDMRRWRGAE